jgi:hypothetical protein
MTFGSDLDCFAIQSDAFDLDCFVIGSDVFDFECLVILSEAKNLLFRGSGGRGGNAKTRCDSPSRQAKAQHREPGPIPRTEN